MLHTDSRFSQAVQAAVSELEEGTDAEVVVVAAPSSGSYRDVAAAFGAGAAWIVLLIVLFSPFHFSAAWIPLELPLTGLLASWVALKNPRLLRLLTREERRRRQVREAANAAFHEEVVHGTRARTGLLIYVSALEDRVVVIPDLGLEARVPRADWNGIHWGDDGDDPARPHDLDHFLAGLKVVGEVLAARVPATGENPNEITDAPRIRS